MGIRSDLARLYQLLTGQHTVLAMETEEAKGEKKSDEKESMLFEEWDSQEDPTGRQVTGPEGSQRVGGRPDEGRDLQDGR